MNDLSRAQTRPMLPDDPMVWVRLRPTDWRIAGYLMSELSDFELEHSWRPHRLWACAPCRPDAAGERQHHCRVKDAPHAIRVCIKELDNVASFTALSALALLPVEAEN